MGNISGLSQVTTAAQSLSNLILVSPQKTIGYQPTPVNLVMGGQPLPLPPPLLFHYEGEQTSTLESDITDHYIEDNTALQDQIALRPEEVTTHGFIGELNDVAPAILAPVQFVANKLTTIGAYLPGLSITALDAYNQAFSLYQAAMNAANSAVSTWASINGTGGESVIDGNGISLSKNQTKQQIMYQQLYGYWKSRTLFTVQTPWAVFQSMAIKRIVAVQDEKTNVVTDFSVVFKIIRTTRSLTVDSETVDLGTSTPGKGPSLSGALTSEFPGLGA